MKECLFLIILFLSSSLNAYELAIAAQFRDEAPYLKEWIEYHHMIGVDHFWLYNNSSEDNWEEVLQPYMESGLVEVFYWPSERSNYQSYHTMANQDALRRAKGNTKWVALIDIDEFLLPMKEKTMPECLEKHFSKASAIYANWRMFGTGGIYIDPYQPIISKLTSCSFKHHPRNLVGKTILRPERTDIDKIWYEHYMPLLPDVPGYFDGNGEDLHYDGTTLLDVPKHCDKYLRINHYNLRDENFYQNIRLPRAKSGVYGDPVLFEEHHESFSLIKDQALINFIKKNYPEMYESFWKN
ncbi:MAG TPA: glycosyltransferase family 92 protein [Chlamydiales bacterium]|nr:glycosyltransferase family 92 protein [Chlamydiales bacterium]